MSKTMEDTQSRVPVNGDKPEIGGPSSLPHWWRLETPKVQTQMKETNSVKSAHHQRQGPLKTLKTQSLQPIQIQTLTFLHQQSSVRNLHATSTVSTETAGPPDTSPSTALTDTSSTSPSTPISTQRTQATETSQTIFSQEFTTFFTSSISTETPLPSDTSLFTTLTDRSSTSSSIPNSTTETQATEASQTVFAQGSTTMPTGSVSIETVLPPDTSYTSAVSEASTTSQSSLTSTRASERTETSQTVFIQESTTFSTSSVSTKTGVAPDITHPASTRTLFITLPPSKFHVIGSVFFS